MTDRDRLIELLDQKQNYGSATATGINYIQNTELADYLLANGVELSPLPIGSTVYEIRARGKRPALCGMRKCDYSVVCNSYIKNAIAHGFEFYVSAKKFVKYDRARWNKTVFESKEQAEEKVKELRNNG